MKNIFIKIIIKVSYKNSSNNKIKIKITKITKILIKLLT